MDYENIVYNCNCPNSNQACWLGCKDLGWDSGEITEIELPIFGGFTTDGDCFISITDFMGGSSTKLVRMVLQDHLGDTVDIQEVLANSKDMEYYEDHLSCYYVVDQELSGKLKPGSYSLYVYLVNRVSEATEKQKEEIVFNKMVTGPSGLSITIY